MAYFTIVNPAAGGGRGKTRANLALDSLRASGFELEVHDTRAPGDATALVREGMKQGARHFLVVGGDGTAFEAINGAFPRTDSLPLTFGFLPVGTGNSFLRDFRITDTDGALAALQRGALHDVDVVRAVHEDGEIYYINLLSIGFSAEAGELTNRRFKSYGAAGYVLAVLGCLLRLAPQTFPLKLDGGAWNRDPCTLLSFSNSQYTGGTMHMAPGASVSDGVVDVVRVGAMGRGTLLGAFPGIFRGTHVSRGDVSVTRARRIDFELPQAVPVMVDGEVMNLRLRSLEVLPKALSVIA